MTRPSIVRSAVAGRQRAAAAAATLGHAVRESRLRRRLTQKALAERVGVTRSQIAKIETERGVGVRPAQWFALADALGRYLKFEFARDPLEEPADAGHLDIQKLVVRLGIEAGFDSRRVELPGRTGKGWTDVALAKRAERVLVLIECVNTFGDIGASFRSTDRKRADAEQLAATLGGDGPPFTVSVCWVVRDSARNRELLRRYEELFASRFTGSSVNWVAALKSGGPVPSEPGLVWCDSRATRVFAWRQTRARGTVAQ